METTPATRQPSPSTPPLPRRHRLRLCSGDIGPSPPETGQSLASQETPFRSRGDGHGVSTPPPPRPDPTRSGRPAHPRPNTPPSDIRHPTSDIRHPTSDIRHPASGIRHPLRATPSDPIQRLPSPQTRKRPAPSRTLSACRRKREKPVFANRQDTTPSRHRQAAENKKPGQPSGNSPPSGPKPSRSAHPHHLDPPQPAPA